MFKTFSVAAGLFAVHKFQNPQASQQKVNLTRNAICILFPNENSGVNGIVSFQQEHVTAKTKIVAVVRGLRPNSLHGMHIHEYGDVTQGCATAGAHYNPFNKRHGGPLDIERHAGDLGNIKADEKGNGYLAYEDSQVQLHGEHSILGRSVVIHQNEDDLGKGGVPESSTTGNSGPRVACGVIGLSSAFKNLQPY